MASLDGDSVGLARGSGSNEKVEMTRSVEPGEGRTVLIYSFLPWLCWLLMSNEATAASWHNMERSGAFCCMCDA